MFLPSFNQKIFKKPQEKKKKKKKKKNPNDKAIQIYFNAHNPPNSKHYTV